MCALGRVRRSADTVDFDSQLCGATLIQANVILTGALAARCPTCLPASPCSHTPPCRPRPAAAHCVADDFGFPMPGLAALCNTTQLGWVGRRRSREEGREGGLGGTVGGGDRARCLPGLPLGCALHRGLHSGMLTMLLALAIPAVQDHRRGGAVSPHQAGKHVHAPCACRATRAADRPAVVLCPPWPAVPAAPRLAAGVCQRPVADQQAAAQPAQRLHGRGPGAAAAGRPRGWRPAGGGANRGRVGRCARLLPVCLPALPCPACCPVATVQQLLACLHDACAPEVQASGRLAWSCTRGGGAPPPTTATRATTHAASRRQPSPWCPPKSEGEVPCSWRCRGESSRHAMEKTSCLMPAHSCCAPPLAVLQVRLRLPGRVSGLVVWGPRRPGPRPRHLRWLHDWRQVAALPGRLRCACMATELLRIHSLTAVADSSNCQQRW